MFRRRRSADVDRDWPGEPEGGQELADDEFDDEAYDEPAEDEWPAEGPRAEGGPWDAGEPVPPRERVDLGSLQVPMGPEHEIQLVMADQHGAWVTVRHGESEMQVQAFAAARRGALWDDVRAEIAKEVREAGGDSEEIQGSFGTELMARVPAEPGQPASGLRLVRFVGVDGPRWFLRGLFTGPAADGGEPAEPARGDLQGRRGGARRAPGAAAGHPGAAAAPGGAEGVRGAGTPRRPRRTGSGPT